MKSKVYLAGGMNSNWQKKIIDELSDQFIFFNPSEHKLDDVKEYKVWDLYYVKNCDILFGYMEKSNPSGYGLALEIGYAKALNKLIILVDERSHSDATFHKNFKFIQLTSDIYFNKIEDGITMLSSMCRGIK
ncbi:nucleoside 2-deoxyribosyltransferase domain-containing protein [Marivirga sp.]|uniref:nucleoside 2-deoxyribosyltransferase domain-containing protein n=1 Tax=Marivirga sp. TaxID=2018662 RepID=UPI002D7F22D1|nr:nucleoside 2-deoxyribosyltransferase domain-containing protein [Marivirga sp.]HET8859537.1 nucleoside 2-deoxyribosyltransferase domain-containing protein [Marivirga sp.]